jgi:hypothetical protein
MKHRTATMQFAPLVALLLLALSAHPLIGQKGASLAPEAEVSPWMRAVFGNYDTKSQTSRAAVPGDNPDLKGSGFSPGDPLVVHPLWSSQYGDPALHQWVLLTYAVPFDPNWKPLVPEDQPFSCHACSPLIGMYLLTATGGQWHADASSVNVTRAGGWGEPPSGIREISVGLHHAGIEIPDAWQGGGETSKAIQNLTFWQNKPSLSILASTGDDNLGNCASTPADALPPWSLPPCYRWKKTLTFVKRPSSDFDDIVLTLSGTNLDDSSKLHQVSGIQMFRYKNGKYVLFSQHGSAASAF